MWLRAALLLVVLAACTTGSAPPPVTSPPVSSTTLPPLDDPGLLESLGLAPPADITWQRTVAGRTVVGRGTSPDPEELGLLEAALAEVPQALSRQAQPRLIVRIPSAEGRAVDPAAAAYVVGPDIYLVDATFLISPGGTTRFDLARAYGHELGHVAQFLTLRPEYVRGVLNGNIPAVDAGEGSGLVEDFARATGWVRSEGGWTLPGDVTASTEYGSTGPDEDMAESVAMVMIGRPGWISEDRVAWVESWLRESAEQLASGKPWAPAGSTEVLSDQPIYDEGQVAALAAQHVEPLYFALPEGAPAASDLAAEVNDRLAARGLSGNLAPHPDERLPRYSGTFSRPDGLVLWVELWDFREATGFQDPPGYPILTYVVMW